MFGTTHILYMIISVAVTAAVIAALCFIKSKRLNKAAIWFSAIITVIIHFSAL